MYGKYPTVSPSPNVDVSHTSNQNTSRTVSYENVEFSAGLDGKNEKATSIVIENNDCAQYVNQSVDRQAAVNNVHDPPETGSYYVNVSLVDQPDLLPEEQSSSDDEDFQKVSKFRRCANNHSDTGNQLNKTSTSQGGGDGDHYDGGNCPTIVENVLNKLSGHLDSTLVSCNNQQTSSSTLTCQGGDDDDDDDPIIVENVLYKPSGHLDKTLWHSEHMDDTVDYYNVQPISRKISTYQDDTTIVENDLYRKPTNRS